MTEATDLASLQSMVKRFCESRDWDQFHAPEQLAIGVVTEAAELLEIFRFKTPEQIRELMASAQGKEKVSDELADVLFFLLRFAQMNKIDLAAALEAKVAKNEAKYPVAKSWGKNLKYDDLPE